MTGVREFKFQTNGRTRTARANPERTRADHTLAHALESHIKTLQGENKVLKQQLAAV